MKRNIATVILVVAMTMMCASCLDRRSNEEYNFYGDAAITSFSLGTVNQYLIGIRKSTGVKDSIYKQTYAGSNYIFNIDHVNGLIFNADSLPYGTDPAHILATITAKNSGTVLLKDYLDEDFYYYSSSDSIDFTGPLTIRVNSQSGENQRDYTVKVNVHQQEGDVFNWTTMGTVAELAVAPTFNIRAAADDIYALVPTTALDRTFVYDLKKKLDGAAPTVYELGAEAYKNAAAFNGKLYVLDGQQMKVFEDGNLVLTQTADAQVKRLLGAGETELYALSDGGKFLSSVDNGVTWKEEIFNDDKSLLPTVDLNFFSYDVETNEGMEQVVLAGYVTGINRMMVWSKLFEVNTQAAWTYVDLAGDYRYAAPKLTGLTVLPYGDEDIAIGVKADGTYSNFMVSTDGGITWHASSQYAYPTGFNKSKSVFSATTDSNYYIWLVDNTGQVWRGRLNKMGWEKR